MLARLDHAFDGQRRFVANAAHELRMPLTLNRSLVEVAMHRPAASDDVKQLGEVLLDINARHERLINGLLLLARTEHGITDRSYVDLSDVADHVVGETAAEGRTATVSTAEAPVLGDALLLERLVSNLVDNAIRHNVAGGWLHVATDTVADRARLVVTNTGPAVPRVRDPGPVRAVPPRRCGARRQHRPRPVHRPRDRARPRRAGHRRAPRGRRPGGHRPASTRAHRASTRTSLAPRPRHRSWANGRLLISEHASTAMIAVRSHNGAVDDGAWTIC